MFVRAFFQRYSRKIIVFAAVMLIAAAVVVACVLMGNRAEDKQTLTQPSAEPTIEPTVEPTDEILEGIVKIDTSSIVYAAIDVDGKVYVWGGEEVMAPPADLPPIVDIAVGNNHIVALDENGRLHGWGNPTHGEIDFSALPKMIAVAADGFQTTALSEDGKVYKWGNTNKGSQEYVPKNMEEIVQIENGAYITAALGISGRLYVWGINQENIPKCEEPAILAPLADNLIVLGKDGKVYGTIPHRNKFRKYKGQPALGRVVKLSGGNTNLAAVDENGRLSIWGEYSVDEKGYSIVNIPLNLPEIRDVALGDESVACLGTDGKVYAWGRSSDAVPDEIDGFQDTTPEFKLETEEYPQSVEVNNVDEFLEVLQSEYRYIKIKKSMVLSGDSLDIDRDTTLIINPGVVVRVEMMHFYVYGTIINRGDLVVSGRMVMMRESPEIGNVETTGKDEVILQCDYLSLTEIKRYLARDSVFTGVAIVAVDQCNIVIDEDYKLPKGKRLWLNINCTLVVNEGVTLKVKGVLETVNPPVVNGKVVGTITCIKAALCLI